MITSISITNYKSIKNLPSIQFGQTNFLIGKNGVGKSNLISVIELTRRLAMGQSFTKAAETISPFGIEFFTRGENISSATISICLRNKSSRYELSYTVGEKEGELSITNERLSWVIDSDTKLEVYIRKPGSFIGRSSSSDPLIDIPLAIKDTELALASFNNPAAIDAAKLMSNCKVLWFDRSSEAEAYDFHTHRLDALDISNLDGLAVSLHENNIGGFNKAVSVIKQIIPEFIAPRISSIAPSNNKNIKGEEENVALKRFIVFWGENQSREIQYTLSGLSDGNFRIIQLIFALFDAEDSSFLVGEEIENGQHYGRIKTLIEVLKHLSIRLNIQLLFSTHSSDLLGYVAPSDVIYCARDQDGYSTYKRLSESGNVDMVKEELGREPTAKELIDFGIV